MLKIDSIHVKYFRSLYDEQVSVGDINTFVGLNDAGKSNLLKALNLFFNGQTGWQEDFNFTTDFNNTRRDEFDAPNRPKKAKEIIITLKFKQINGSSPVWRKTWQADRKIPEKKHDNKSRPKERNPDTGFKPRSKVPAMLDKIKYYYVPALKGPEYISYLIGKLSEIITEKARKDILGAADGFERHLSDYLADITGDIEKTLNIKSLLKLPPNLVKIFENMEFSDEKGVALSHRGDGIRTRHIPILLKKISTLHTNLKKKGELFDYFIWGYEEPENNVELMACFKLAKQFLEISETHQIFITTHSPAFYGLPERNYKGWEQGRSGVFRYRVENIEARSKFSKTTLNELDTDFLLPSATRLIEKEIVEKDKLGQRCSELEMQINKDQKPAIIVEGLSDYLVMEKALKVFFPEKLQDVLFQYPKGSENGGGANFVKNNLIVWGHAQSQTPPDKRLCAIGLFDKDKAGLSAKDEFNNHSHKSNTTAFAKFYTFDHRIQNPFSGFGIKLEANLENLYMPMLWEEAANRNWLEDTADPTEFLEKDAKKRLVSTTDTIKTIIVDDNLRRYVTHKFRGDCKVIAAKHIAELDDKEARKILVHFEDIMRDALKRINLMND